MDFHQGPQLTNYEVSTNGGSTWTPMNPAQIASPLIVSGLSAGTYSVSIRAVNTAGAGVPSVATPATVT